MVGRDGFRKHSLGVPDKPEVQVGRDGFRKPSLGVPDKSEVHIVSRHVVEGSVETVLPQVSKIEKVFQGDLETAAQEVEAIFVFLGGFQDFQDGDILII